MKRENDLGRDDVGALVWRTALPSMLAQFVSVLYSIVDRMYIGHIAGAGETALALSLIHIYMNSFRKGV